MIYDYENEKSWVTRQYVCVRVLPTQNQDKNSTSLNNIIILENWILFLEINYEMKFSLGMKFL